MPGQRSYTRVFTERRVVGFYLLIYLFLELKKGLALNYTIFWNFLQFLTFILTKASKFWILFNLHKVLCTPFQPNKVWLECWIDKTDWFWHCRWWPASSPAIHLMCTLKHFKPVVQTYKPTKPGRLCSYAESDQTSKVVLPQPKSGHDSTFNSWHFSKWPAVFELQEGKKKTLTQENVADQSL